MKIEIKKITDWKVASKTKDITAKPVISLIVDKKVTSKFLLDTLEGKANIVPDSQICIGGAGDAWQQSAVNLLKKYDVIAIDAEGWMVCRPKPGNKVNCVEITDEIVRPNLDPSIHDNRQDDGNYYIIGKYGEPSDEGFRQHCKTGDFILQDRDDPSDTWIVDRKMFLNTYDIVS
jgi:hypothetical protein